MPNIPIDKTLLVKPNKSLCNSQWPFLIHCKTLEEDQKGSKEKDVKVKLENKTRKQGKKRVTITLPLKPTKDVTQLKSPNTFVKREFKSDNTNFESLPHGSNQEKHPYVVVVSIWSPHTHSSNSKPLNAKKLYSKDIHKICVRIEDSYLRAEVNEVKTSFQQLQLTSDTKFSRPISCLVNFLSRINFFSTTTCRFHIITCF